MIRDEVRRGGIVREGGWGEGGLGEMGEMKEFGGDGGVWMVV